MARCLIIDYGLGNLVSVRQALEQCGASVSVQTHPVDLESFSLAVLPGVGSFAEGMRNLHHSGWVDPLQEAVRSGETRLLGVCLGMQLLAEFGSEGGGIEGLGLIEGDVEKLRPDDPSPRIPHMGWNEVHLTRECPLVDSTIDGSDFYFVHSYHLIPRNSDQLVATTPYCGDFASIVADTNILGVQFHPEKSQKLGLRLLSHLMAN